jgi:hypothetical protein
MNPARAGCSLRNTQTFSVAGGSKGKSLLNVLEDALDRGTSTGHFVSLVRLQIPPFGTQSFQAKLQCEIKQQTESRSQ